MSTANVNALFQGLKSKPSFSKTITIAAGDPEEAILLAARREIRSALRIAFGAFRANLFPDEIRKSLFSRRDFKFHDSARAIHSIDIRFLTQGSHAYGTLNRPAQPEYQEVDLDDGVYVPLPFVDGRPIYSSEGLFRIIQDALAPLAKSKGWTFKQKDTCVRICLPGKNAHIDLPLFAVEQKSFQDLSDLYERQMGTSFRKTIVSLNEILDSTAKNVRLLSSSILLADRQEDWRPSDPKEIHDWFESQVTRYGPVLRRLCRYFKAWRDETWTTCSLSSLTIMVACVEGLKALDLRPTDMRDDLLVLHVANALSDKFQNGKISWRVGEQPLDTNWSASDRQTYVAKARDLAKEVDSALNGTFHKEIVIRRLQSVFGDRFPNAPDAISIAASSQTAAVLQTAPISVAMPIVGTSVSA